VPRTRGAAARIARNGAGRRKGAGRGVPCGLPTLHRRAQNGGRRKCHHDRDRDRDRDHDRDRDRAPDRATDHDHDRDHDHGRHRSWPILATAAVT
jgi:hypothetical protein